MIPLAFDENFNNDVLRGLLRRHPQVDLIRVQDAGLSGRPDPFVLAWAAEQRRILVSHDVSTLTAYAYERVRDGLSMPGLVEVGPTVSSAVAIEDLALITLCSRAGEWEGQVIYLPLR
jgi:hypothetical protein